MFYDKFLFYICDKFYLKIIFLYKLCVWQFTLFYYLCVIVFFCQLMYMIEFVLTTYLYYKSWNNWNSFSPRLGPPYPSRWSHLSAQRFDERGCRRTKLIKAKCFHTTTKHLIYPGLQPLLVPVFQPGQAIRDK